MIARRMGASTELAPRHHELVGPALVIAGAVVALAGSALPWVTILRGTQTLTGWDGSPRYLAGVAVASAVLSLLNLRMARSAAFRVLAIVAGLIVLGGSALEIWQVSTLARSGSVVARIVDPVLGPGAFVMLAGALLLVAVVAVPSSAPRASTGLWPRVLLAGVLFVAGWIHLALTPEHLAESTVLGLGFLLAGVGQLALAGLVLVRPSHLAYYAVVALSVALVVLYAFAVLKGLPFGSGHDHGNGLVLGAGEPVDLEGAITKVAELLSVAAAFVLLGRGRE